MSVVLVFVVVGGGAICWFLSFTIVYILHLDFINYPAFLNSHPVFFGLTLALYELIHFGVESHKKFPLNISSLTRSMSIFRRSSSKVCSCFIRRDARCRPLAGRLTQLNKFRSCDALLYTVYPSVCPVRPLFARIKT